MAHASCQGFCVQTRDWPQERRRQAPGLAKVEKAVKERDAQISALQARARIAAEFATSAISTSCVRRTRPQSNVGTSWISRARESVCLHKLLL